MSGCLSECDFKCVITGPQHESINQFVSMYDWVDIVESTVDQSEFEGATLKHLYSDCCNGKVSNVMYMHTKGISHVGSSPDRFRNVSSWRRMLEWGCIDRWSENIKALNSDKGYDVSGVNWSKKPWNHFSGNFWWASSDYISSLDHPVDPASDRLQYEKWVGSKAESVHSMYRTEYDLYVQDINFEYLN
jgi:hypothetical protein